MISIVLRKYLHESYCSFFECIGPHLDAVHGLPISGLLYMHKFCQRLDNGYRWVWFRRIFDVAAYNVCIHDVIEPLKCGTMTYQDLINLEQGGM